MFNANGIVATHGFVVINQSSTGQLFRVDPQTGFATEIETFGTDLVNADGMELRGHLLYVVRSPADVVQRMGLFTRRGIAVPRGRSPATSTSRQRPHSWAITCTWSTPGSRRRRHRRRRTGSPDSELTR